MSTAQQNQACEDDAWQRNQSESVLQHEDQKPLSWNSSLESQNSALDGFRRHKAVQVWLYALEIMINLFFQVKWLSKGRTIAKQIFGGK